MIFQKRIESDLWNYWAFMWHSVFLSITVTFTEINSIIPALILQIGGSEIHVGIVTAIMIGTPLMAQLNFAGYLHGKQRKKPFLLLGIYLRVLSLFLIAFTIFFVRNMSIFIVLFLIYGELILFTVSGAFAGVSYVDLVGKSFGGELRKRFFTRKQLIASIGVLISATVARYILKAYPYPLDYFILFLFAASFLLVGTAGFWAVKEKPGKPGRSMSYLQTIKAIPGILRSDGNLRKYLIFTNAIGFHVALTPFYVSLARHRYFMDSSLAGTLLFIQMLGMVFASLIWPILVKMGGFKLILRVWSAFSLILPITALAIGWLLPLSVYKALFFFIGVSASAWKICENAVIVELTSEENRVLYAGIWGTLNLSMVIAPLFLGFAISSVGYFPVFGFVSLLALGTLFVLKRLVCPVDLEKETLKSSSRTV